MTPRPEKPSLYVLERTELRHYGESWVEVFHGPLAGLGPRLTELIGAPEVTPHVYRAFQESDRPPPRPTASRVRPRGLAPEVS